MAEGKNKCRFVLTYAYCDWDVNGCMGIYDDPDKAMGRIIAEALDVWDHSGPNLTLGYDDPQFQFKFRHDSSNDLYYDVEVRYPWVKNGDAADVYRVYYLREEDDSEVEGDNVMTVAKRLHQIGEE